jgi:O-antigen ligase
VLLLLFTSYAVGAVASGGVIFLATVIRWYCLVLLFLGIFRGLVPPKPTILPFVIYSLLNFVFIYRAPVPAWSLQLAALLMVTVVSIVLSTPGYVKDIRNIRTIFKFGIFAAGLWTVTSAIFVKDFLQATATSRFSVGDTSAVVGSAWAGGFFAPMLMWGVLQRESITGRLVSVLILIPYTFLLILGSVRTAIFGMVLIPLMAIVLVRQKNIRMILSIVIFVILPLALGVYILNIIAPDKFSFLTERLFTTSTTGRVDIWRGAIKLCMRYSMVLGMGVGSAEVASLEIGHLFHNAYLTIWYNAGFLGLLLVVFFLGTYLIKAFRLVYTCANENDVLIAKVLFGYMAGIAAIGMFEGAFSGSGGIAVTMLLLTVSLIDRMKILALREDYALDQETLDYLYVKEDENC